MPVVLVPTAYRGPTRGEAEIRVSGSTVIECLREVDAQYPGFLDLVSDANGAIHRFVKLFINGEQIDSNAVDTALAADDRLEVLAAIAGG